MRELTPATSAMYVRGTVLISGGGGGSGGASASSTVQQCSDMSLITTYATLYGVDG